MSSRWIYAHSKAHNWVKRTWAADGDITKQVKRALKDIIRSGADTLWVCGDVPFADRVLAARAFAKMRCLKIQCSGHDTQAAMWDAFARPECEIEEVEVDGNNPQITPATLRLANPRLHAVTIFGGAWFGRWNF